MAEIIPDNAIYDFLISKGIEVEKPKSSKDLKGRVIDGAITGLNPLVGAANIGLKAIKGNAKQQEWITWKQWALSHAEWNEFWTENKSYYLELEKQRLATLEEKQKEQAIAKEKRRKRGNKIALVLFFWWVPLLAIGLVASGIYSGINYLNCGQVECDSTEIKK